MLLCLNVTLTVAEFNTLYGTLHAIILPLQ